MRKFILCLLLVVSCVGMSVFLASCAQGGSSDMGGTNVQEEGIDEGDIAKYVGDYLYVLQSDGISVSKTNADGTVTLVSTSKQGNVTPCEIYVSNNRLIAIYDYEMNEDGFKRSWSSLRIFDLSGLGDNYSLDEHVLLSYKYRGKYRDSRIIVDKEKLLLCYGIKEEEQLIPYGNNSQNYVVDFVETTLDYELNGTKKVVESVEKLESIPSYLESDDITVYSTINLAQNSFDFNVKATYGFPFQTLYVSEYGFYTAYSYSEIKNESKGCGSRHSLIEHSMIAKIDCDTLELKSQKFFDSMSLISRYAIKDTGENVYFAMRNTNYNAVVVVSTDEDLKLVGSLTDICQNEMIKSVSYTEEDGKLFCMLVTYKEEINLDPLFKIDVTNPENMFVTGLLSIEGFSSYTINFKGYTVCIGEDGIGGVKISLFDTSQNIPKEIKSFVKAHAYSEAVDNSKAFCIFPEANIFAVSIVETTEISSKTQRMYFYQVTDEGMLVELGYVENQSEYLIDTFGEIENIRLFSRRAFFNEKYVFITSDANVVSISLEGLMRGQIEKISDISTVIK